MEENKDNAQIVPTADFVTEILVRAFGKPTLGNKKNPFNELLYIILSSKTPPDRYQEVYRKLRRVYKNADNLADALPEEIAKTISQGGLQNRKARAIASIAKKLKQEFGHVTLAPLKNMANKEAEIFLTSFPEVKKKTARCVLMYALDRPVFPVDTHCFRIAQRLGWFSKNELLTDKRADEFQNIVPEYLRKDLHVGLVLLGRLYCLPRKLRCNKCPLIKVCPSGVKNEQNAS